MLNPTAYANAAPAGVAVLETVQSADLSAALLFVPLRRTTVNGLWDGPLAEITVTHTYGYSHAQCDRVLEAIYRFPLPGDAAVRRVTVSFGDVEIVAALKERGRAEADYEEARRSGRQAALTTRESPDVFTLRLAGLQPDQDVVVDTTYVQLADVDGVGWSLRIPLTTAPRYSRGDEASLHTMEAQPLASFRDPGHRFALDLVTGQGGIVASTTHVLRSTEEDGHTRVRLAEGETLPDRDCVLGWQPVRLRDRPSLRVLTGEDAPTGRTYFAALVSPPATIGDDAPPAREAIVLVDHSGSMNGVKREAADAAALGIVHSLSAGDHFNLGVFHNTCRWLDNAHPLTAGPDCCLRAEEFLAATDSGGTNLGAALESALLQPRTPGGLSRQVVIITDAQVTDEARILKMVESEARRADRRRVSVLCIDAAPNSYLTQQLAQVGGGMARFLTSMPAEQDLTEALQAIVAGWSQPVAVGLRLEINREGCELAGGAALDVRAGWTAADLGDLTMGRSLWLVGRVPTGCAATLRFRLAGAGLPAEEITVEGAPDAMTAPLKAVFGAYRVQGLERLADGGASDDLLAEELCRLGYDPARLPTATGGDGRTVYPENAQRVLRTYLDELLLAEALDYGLLCSRTGFVAVRSEQGRPVEQTAVIGNSLPEGWSRALASASFEALLNAPTLMDRIAPLLRTDPGDLLVRPTGRVEAENPPSMASWHTEILAVCEAALRSLDELSDAISLLARYEGLIAELRRLQRVAGELLLPPGFAGRRIGALPWDLQQRVRALAGLLGEEPPLAEALARWLSEQLAREIDSTRPAVDRAIRALDWGAGHVAGQGRRARPVRQAMEKSAEALRSIVWPHACSDLERQRVQSEVRSAMLALQALRSAISAAGWTSNAGEDAGNRRARPGRSGRRP